MVLLSSPAWLLMGWVALEVLFRLWRRAWAARGELLEVSRIPSGVMAGVALISAGFGASTMTRDGWIWFIDHRFWERSLMIGLGYVTVSLVVWRVWFRPVPKSSFSWALVPGLALLLLAGISLAFSDPVAASGSGTTNLLAAAINLLAAAMLAGFYGLPTAAVYLVLLLEASGAVRRANSRRATAADGPIEPPTRPA